MPSFALMIIPDFLRPGDRIGLIAPARKLDPEAAEQAAQLIRDWGFEPVFGKNLFREQHQFAGSDRERAEDLHDFLMDRSIRAIMAFRGGYGSVRILPFLQSAYPDPKWIVGYSDLTVLHHWANQHLGWASIHGTMPVNMIAGTPEARESNESLRKALCGEPETLKLPGQPFDRPGNARGVLCGGNLSVMYSLLGSDLQTLSEGKLWFLEDLDEYLYHIDRMMQAMIRAGIAGKAAAWLAGGLTDMRDNAIPFGSDAVEIIRDAGNAYSFPVYFGLECGHLPLNRALIFGLNYDLKDSRLIPLL